MDYGSPGAEPYEYPDIDETIQYIKQLRPYVDQMYLNPFSLITGSLMHKTPEKYGLTNIKPVATIFLKGVCAHGV